MKALGNVSRINVICSLSGGTNLGRRMYRCLQEETCLSKAFRLVVKFKSVPVCYLSGPELTFRRPVR